MLREPVGKYKVGITEYDTGLTGDEEHRRRVPLTFFYPVDEWEEECPYKNPDYQKTAPLPVDNGVHTYCGTFNSGEPKATKAMERFPVVIYSHGLNGYGMESTVLCSDIASSGYVVVSVAHPYGSAIVTYTDGTTFVNPQTSEEVFARLDEYSVFWYEDFKASMEYLTEMNESDSCWKGRLDLSRLGSIGVSFGGCCSIIAALKDKDIHYAVNLDGCMFVEPEYIYKDKPILVLCNPFNIKAHRCLSKNGCKNLEVKKIRKVTHFEFSDGVYLSDRGKHDREWADRISKARADKIIRFITDNL